MTTMMTTAAEAIAGRFTLPFARGTSTLSIPLIEGGNATQAQVDNYDFSDYLARFVPQSPPTSRSCLVRATSWSRREI